MKKRLQEFEFTSHCKNHKTALKRFAEKYPKCNEIWGETVEYMLEHNETLINEKEVGGFVINVENEGDFYYIDIQIYDECQMIDETPTYNKEQLERRMKK